MSESLNPQLLDASSRLIKALNWSGVAMVEFKLNPDSGEFCLMEINGRFWGSLPLAVTAGADFPSMLLDLETTGEVVPCAPYREGVYCRLLSRDLGWYEAVLRGAGDQRLVRMPSRTEILSELRLFLRPGHRFDVQGLRDPVPGLVDLRNIVRNYYRRLSNLVTERLFRMRQARCWRSGQVAQALSTADSILFMCYGNINRSALADAMIRAYAEDTGVAVYSAGFHPEDGRRADPVMTEIAAEAGLDLSASRSSTVDEALLRSSDIIFVMEKAHHDRVVALRPDARDQIYLLGAHAGVASGDVEILDPYGQSRDAYISCYRRISNAVDHIKAVLAMRSGD